MALSRYRVGILCGKLCHLWKGDVQIPALRWCASAVKVSEESFRKICGMAQAPALIDARENFKLEKLAV